MKAECQNDFRIKLSLKDINEYNLKIQMEEYRKERINELIKQTYSFDFITNKFKKQTLDSFVTSDKNANMKIIAKKFISNYKSGKRIDVSR